MRSAISAGNRSSADVGFYTAERPLELSSSRPGCKLRVTVELFRRAWLGIVSGVCVPSGLCLTNAMCSRSLTIRKPRDPSAFIHSIFRRIYGKLHH